MTQEEIDKLNNDISYNDGKIYWEHGKGWTSLLFQRLLRDGYTTATSKSGLRALFDPEGKRVLSTFFHSRFLYDIARLFI